MKSVARCFNNINACPSTRTDLAEHSAGSMFDLRLILSPNVPDDFLVSSVATAGKTSLKKKEVSSSKLPYTGKKSSPVFGKIKPNLPSMAGVIKKCFSLRSKSHSVAAFTGDRYAQRTVFSGAHSCGSDNEEVLWIISKPSKPSDSNLKVNSADYWLNVAVPSCNLTLL